MNKKKKPHCNISRDLFYAYANGIISDYVWSNSKYYNDVLLSTLSNHVLGVDISGYRHMILMVMIFVTLPEENHVELYCGDIPKRKVFVQMT